MVLDGCNLLVGESLETDSKLDGHVYDLRVWSRAIAVTDVAGCRKVMYHGHRSYLLLLVLLPRHLCEYQSVCEFKK